ncbi:MAG: hypothetical protein HC799_18470 [Limnothrix sp. RL_2_0]|nr:hypothetical protein [Limnothrix sp. RL_2_0]
MPQFQKMKLHSSLYKALIVSLTVVGANVSLSAIANEVMAPEVMDSNVSLPNMISNEPRPSRFTNRPYANIEPFSLAESERDGADSFDVEVDAAVHAPRSEGKDSPFGMIRFPFSPRPQRPSPEPGMEDSMPEPQNMRQAN